MSVYLVIAIVLAISGVAMWGLKALERSAFMRRYRDKEDLPRKVSDEEHRRSFTVNSAVSTGIVFALSFLLHGLLFRAETGGAARLVLEVVLVLLLYDFGYYLLHRFVFHEWSVGRRWHAVHHRIRTPYAADSLFIHPIETALGVLLLMVCVLIVGPISVYAFGATFLIYSVLNVFIHSGFHLPFFPFRGLSALVTHHDIHHESMKSGYYASMTPLFDILFGTATRRKRRKRA